MEQTTDAGTYTYYYYNLGDGDSITDMQDIIQWVQENHKLLQDPHHATGSKGDQDYGDYSQHDDHPKNDQDFVYHDSSHLRGFVQSANIGIIITVCNILINLILIFLVLLRRCLRTQFVYQQIVNLALADLCFSVMVDPFTVYFELQPWRLAPAFCVGWMVMDAALPFVAFLVLIFLNLDRLFFAMSPATYRHSFKRPLLRLLVLLLPWALAMGVILPLWLLTAVAWPQLGMCMYGITKKAAVASACLSLYLPCVLLIILTVLILVSIIGGMPHESSDLSRPRGRGLLPLGNARWPTPNHAGWALPPSVNNNNSIPPNTTTVTSNSISHNLTRDGSVDSCGSGERGHGLEGESAEVRKSHRGVVVALCVLNLLTVITQLPYGAISLLEPQCVEPQCLSTIKLLQSLSWVRSITFTLHPLFLLLLLPHVRRACCTLCGGKQQPQGGQGSGSEVSGLTSKSDHIELTSIHHDANSAARDKDSATML